MTGKTYPQIVANTLLQPHAPRRIEVLCKFPSDRSWVDTTTIGHDTHVRNLIKAYLVEGVITEARLTELGVAVKEELERAYGDNAALKAA